MDGASRAGLKGLYSDARKRAGVAAGIGAYLYTALEPVVLPSGPDERQVQLFRRSNRPDVLVLSAATEEWLRHGYSQRMGTDAVRRDLGEILAHGEPEDGMGQGEAAEQEQQAEKDSAGQEFWEDELQQQAEPSEQAEPTAERERRREGNGVVVVDFGGVGPDAA
jgi:hypothetical protein